MRRKGDSHHLRAGPRLRRGLRSAMVTVTFYVPLTLLKLTEFLLTSVTVTNYGAVPPLSERIVDW